MRREENDAAGGLTVLVLIFLGILVFCAWNDSRPVIDFTPEQTTQQGR